MDVIVEGLGHSSLVATYELPDTQLPVGSTLGGAKVCTVIKSTGAIQNVWSTDIGANIFGTVLLRHHDVRSGMPLTHSRAGSFVIHPEHQEHRYALLEDLEAYETIFVWNGRLEDGRVSVPPAVYLMLEMRNTGREKRHVSTCAFADVRGSTGHDVKVVYDADLNAFVAWNESTPQHVRLFGSSLVPYSYETTLDAAMATVQQYPGKLSEDTNAHADPIAVIQHLFTIEPGQKKSLYYLLSFSPNGRADAEKVYRSCPPADEALEQTKRHYHDLLDATVVMTPNPEINRGVLWAKANMLRVGIDSPTGWCITNDPGRSSNSVARDTAWFSLGTNYFEPQFSKDSLLAYVRYQEKNGKIVEYYDIRTGQREDYGLNINDDTPLIVYALWRYYLASGDVDFLKQVFPAARNAVDYILSQRNEHGLVWCTSTGVAEHGIVGWRNVIQDYRISGATTEINSECYAAINSVSGMAKVLGESDKSAEYSRHAEELKAAINKHLRNPDNGLYYLNIDTHGNPHSDITCDLVFPLLFGVAPPDAEALILNRLSNENFWTRAGMRTVPRDSIDYTPYGGWGLLGGVWVGVAFWYAFAASKHAPEFMDRALGTTFQNYSRDPLASNTVPGQFSEWLDGETLVNRGMMLSPWFPPRYVWAAVEGVAGVTPTPSGLKITPRLAPSWKWMAIYNLLFRGERITYFAANMPELHIFSNTQFEADSHLEIFEEDISRFAIAERATIAVLAVRTGSRIVILAGSSDERTSMTSVRLTEDCRLSGHYKLRTYDSLIAEWSDQGVVSAAAVNDGFVVQIEHKGFVLLELTRADKP